MSHTLKDPITLPLFRACRGAIPENALLPALRDHNQQQKSVISGHKQAPLQVTFAAETLPFHIFAKLNQAPAPAGWLT